MFGDCFFIFIESRNLYAKTAVKFQIIPKAIPATDTAYEAYPVANAGI
jgi:hypothetical protein